MNQALYPVDKIEWCVYALYKQDTERIGTYCTIVTTYRHANMAQSLDGYLWAVSSLKKEKMRIRCLEDSHLEDIKPPLTIVYIGDGCEGYSSNLFIPAKSELTSEDETLTRHVFFLDLNDAPPPPPPRGLMPPIKRVLPAKSTEQITEALKEVMLELEPR